MAAATVTNSKALAQMRKKIEGALRNVEDGIVPIAGSAQDWNFGDSFSIPTTSLDDANDIQKLYKFPSGAYIWDLRATPSDMDTNATPTLVYSLLVIDDADATKVTLVSGSTNGQAAAGSDRIANAAVGEFVGDFWLAFKVTTGAATAAAGTIKVALKISLGLCNYDGGNRPRMTDAAV